MTALDVILDMLDRAYDHQSWHGPNLHGILRGVDADAAQARPASNRKSIWEHVVHAAYWKYVVRRKLMGEKRGSFPLKGSNWFDRSNGGSSAEWKQDLKLLNDTHTTLRAAVEALSEEHLQRKPRNSSVRYLDLISGIIAHDVYHAGQIALIKRMSGHRRG